VGGGGGGGGGDITENKMFLFPLLLSETFFILSSTEREMVKDVYESSCKVPANFVRLNEI